MSKIIDLKKSLLKEGESITGGGIILPASVAAKHPQPEPEPETKEGEEESELSEAQISDYEKARAHLAIEYVKTQERFEHYIKSLCLLFFNFIDNNREIEKQRAELLRLNGVFLNWLIQHKEYDHDTNMGAFIERMNYLLAMDIRLVKQMLENEAKEREESGTTEETTDPV